MKYINSSSNAKVILGIQKHTWRHWKPLWLPTAMTRKKSFISRWLTSINIHLPPKIKKVMMWPLEGGYRRSRVGSSAPVDWVGSSWQGELIWTHTFWRVWKVELFDVPVSQGGGFWTNICGQVEQVAMELHLPPIHQQKRCFSIFSCFILALGIRSFYQMIENDFTCVW